MASPADLSNHPPGDSATSVSQAGMEPSIIKIIPLAKPGEGDVVLVLKAHREAVLMNAKVLSDASPVFKEILESGASNRAPRASTHPQEIELPENVSVAYVLFYKVTSLLSTCQMTRHCRVFMDWRSWQ
jgi:hypothetical protein